MTEINMTIEISDLHEQVVQQLTCDRSFVRGITSDVGDAVAENIDTYEIADRISGEISMSALHPTTMYTAAVTHLGACSQNIRITMPITAADQTKTSIVTSAEPLSASVQIPV
jgi:hypothetical protein